MSWRKYSTSGDPDPIVYLGPVAVLGGAGAVSPTVEEALNFIVGWGALAVAVGTAVYVAWLFWGPRPEPELPWAEPVPEPEPEQAEVAGE